VKVAGLVAPGSPVSLVFATGDAATVRLAMSPAGPRVVGEPYTLTVSAMDLAKSPVAGVAVQFTADPGVSFVDDASTCVTGPTGECTAHVVSTRVGVFEVGGSFGGGQPLTDAPVRPQWTAGAVCVTDCAPDDPAHVTRVEVIKNGANFDNADRDIVKVWAYDRYGNPVADQTVASTTSEAVLSIQPVIAATAADGSSTIWYTSTAPGRHVADVTVGGAVPQGSPVALNFGAGLGDPAQSSFTIQPLVSNSDVPLVSGDQAVNTYEVTATVKDYQGAPVNGDSVTFAIQPGGPAWGAGAFSCQTVGGTCTVTVSSTTAGTFAVTGSLARGLIGQAQSVVWRSDAVCGVDCTPEPGVDPAHTTRVEVTVDNQAADNAAADVVTVFAFDRWGNPVPNALVSSTSTAADLRIQQGINPTDGNGQSTISYYSKKSGSYSAAVTVGTANDPKVPTGSPVSVTFGSGALSEANSSFVIVPASQVVGSQVQATFMARDVSDNPVTGLAASALVLEAAGLTVVSGPTERSGGLYDWVLTTTVAGDYEVAVTAGGVRLMAGVTFTPGAVDGSKSKLVAVPSVQTAGSLIGVTVTVVDGYDNPLSTLTAADFAVAGTPVQTEAGVPDIAGMNFVNSSGGRYAFDITSAVAARFTLTGRVSGVLVADQPVVEFTSGGVCVVNCVATDPTRQTRAEMLVNGSVNDGQSADTARVFAFDTYGNPVANAEVVATRQSAQLNPATQTVHTRADGTADVAWTSTSIGTFTAEVSVDGLTGFPGAVLNDIQFTTTGVSAVNSQLAVTPPSGELAPIQVRHSYTATVTVKDGQQQVLAGVPVSFSTTAAPGSVPGAVASPSAPTCVTNDNGTCSITVTSRLAATYELVATVSVDGTPTPITGSPAHLVFKAGPVCVADCTPLDQTHVSRVEVTKNGAKADGNAQDQATIYAYDADGNPVAGAQWSTATADSHLIIVSGSGATGADGTAVLSYTSKYSGVHQADVKIADLTPTGSPVSLLFGAGDAAAVRLSTSPAGPQTVGDSYNLTATATDLANAAVPDVVVQFTAEAGVVFADGRSSCVTGALGTCSVQVTSQQAGVFEVNGSFGAGQPLQDAPRSLEWIAGGVCVSDCTPSDPNHLTRVEIVKNGAKNDGVDQDIVKIFAHDKFGNPVGGQTVASTTADPDLRVQPVIEATAVDGTSTVWYTSRRAGGHVADVSVAGLAPAGSPVTLGFGRGLGDPGRSSFAIAPKLSTTPAPLIAGDQSENTYVVTARVNDVYGDPVADETVTFSVTPSGPVWSGGVFSCQSVDGVCSVEVSSLSAGTFSIGAQLAKGAIGQAQSVAWRPDEVCGQGCTPDPGVDGDHRTRVEVTVNDRTADDTAADQVVVYAFDRHGNPVVGALTASQSASPDLRVQQGIPATDGRGRSSIEYFSKVAGSYQAGVTVGGKVPAGSPVALRFVAGGVCVAPGCVPDPDVPNDRRTRIEVTVDGQVADGSGEDVARLFAFDQRGNAVANVPVQVTAVDATALTVLQPVPVTDGTGVSQFMMTSVVAGGHQARVYVLVAGQPVEVVFVPQPVPPASGPAPAEMVSSPITVHFVAGGPCVAPSCVPDPAVPNEQRTRIEVNPDYQDADGSARDVANVYVFDAHGNPVAGTVITSTTGVSELTVQPAASISPTNGSGVGTVWYSASKPGGHQARVFVQVNGSAVEVRFVPQPVPPATGAAPGEMVSSPITVNFVDVAQPAAPVITEPSSGAQLNNNRPPITGTGEPGASIEVKAGGAVLCSAKVELDGSWSCTPDQPLADGSHTLTAVQTDVAGSVSVPSAPVTVTIDTAAPNPPVVTKPADGESVGSGTPKFEGTAEPGSKVEVIDQDGNTLCETTTNATGDWSCTSSPLPDGEHTAKAQATDPAGNTSDSTNVDFTVDTVPPAPGSLRIDTPAEGAVVNTTTPTISGVAEPGSTVTVKENGETYCTTTADSTGAWSCIPPILAEGPHTVVAVSTDAAGNNSQPVSRNFAVDITRPNPPHIIAPADGETVGDSTPTVSGDDGEPGATVTVTDEDGRVLCTAQVAQDGTWSCASSVDLDDGDHTIRVTQTDPSGNTSDPAKTEVVVDTVPPEAPTVTKPRPGQSVRPDDVEVAGEAEPGSTVIVDAGDGNTCTTVADEQGHYACTLPKPLPEGPDTITVTAKDAAGNESDPTTVTVEADSTAPSPPTVDTSDPGHIKGEADPDSTVTVTDEDGVELCVAKPDAQGQWSCVPSHVLKPGDKIHVTAVDEGGNSSTTTVRVLGITVVRPSLARGDTQTVHGLYFQPGEKVSAVLPSTRLDLGVATADAQGRVTFTWVIPGDANFGNHQVALSGDISGPVRGTFQVAEAAPATGAAASAIFIFVSALVLLLGVAFLILFRRHSDRNQ
jgi:hypothetical protein